MPPEPAAVTTATNLRTISTGLTEAAAGGPCTLRHIQVSGLALLDQYTRLFCSLIMPLAQNNIEIEIRIKGKTA